MNAYKEKVKPQNRTWRKKFVGEVGKKKEHDKKAAAKR